MQPHNEAKKAASTLFDASFKLTLGNLFFDLVGSELDFISSILFGSIYSQSLLIFNKSISSINERIESKLSGRFSNFS